MQFDKLENSDIEKINTPSSGEISQILENPFIENPSIEKVEQLKCNINPLHIDQSNPMENNEVVEIQEDRIK